MQMATAKVIFSESFSKIQIDFTFLVLAHLGSPGKRAVKCVCVCVRVCMRACACEIIISLHLCDRPALLFTGRNL